MKHGQETFSNRELEFLKSISNQLDKLETDISFQLNFNDKDYQRYLENNNTHIPINLSDSELMHLAQLGYLTINIEQEPTTIIFNKATLEEFASKNKRKQKRSKRPLSLNEKLTLIGVLIMFVTAIAAYAVVPEVRNALHLDAPSPEQVLASFCSSIKSNELENAYKAYSNSLQSRVSFGIFKQQWGETEECTYDISSSSQNQAYGNIAIKKRGFNQNQTYVVLLINENTDNWIIDSVQSS